MYALKYQSPWLSSVVELADLQCLEPDDIIVHVALCGICGTDIGILTGDYNVAHPGVTLGHEAAGTVALVGKNVSRFNVGDRVVINPTYACGVCRPCTTGRANHCASKNGTEAGVSSDGAFADQYRAKERFLTKLDDHVSFAAATMTEPLSCAITGVDKLNIQSKDLRVCVIGAGPMGLCYTWALHDIGLEVTVSENNACRRTWAERAIPTGTTICASFEECIATFENPADMTVDVVVDTTGALAESVLKHLSPGGQLLTVALKEKIAKVSTLQIADKSLSIIGSIDSLNNAFERAYQMISQGRIPAEAFISHRIPARAYKDGFAVVGCDLDRQHLRPPSEDNCKVVLEVAINDWM